MDYSIPRHDSRRDPAADERELIETVARRVTARVLAVSRAGEPLTVNVS